MNAVPAPARPRPARPPTPRGVVAGKVVVHGLALLPLVLLARDMLDVYRTGSDALGADPVATVEHTLGLWALRFLLLTLAITPLRQLLKQPMLLRFRRMLGLYAFAYATLHFTAWLVLDMRGFWAVIAEDLVKRPYITVGFAAWLLLLPLAATSTVGWMRRLGRNWGRLHRLVYAIAVLAVLHFWWLVKSDIREPLLYASILAVLLGWRIAKAWQRRRQLQAGTASRPS